jgi:glycine/D-amino acid oxidase-like deaminating enzyme
MASAAPSVVGPDQQRSLWRTTAPAAPETFPLGEQTEADVAIVGAGYTGLACAIALAEAGRKVTVLEAREIGYGASGRNGGQVIPGLKHDPEELVARYGRERGEALARLSGGAADRVFALISKYGIDCAARQCGWIQPAHSAAAAQLVVSRARQWAARRAPVELLAGPRLAQLLGTGEYRAGWLDRRAGALQPLAYARGLARTAMRLGVRVHEGSQVEQILHHTREWAAITREGEVRARQLVLATDAYSGALWPELVANQMIVTSVQIATDPLPDAIRSGILPGGTVASDTRKLLYYFRLDADGRFLIGGRGGVSDEVPARVYATLREVATRMFPALAGVPWPFRWYGRVGITRDWLPHLAEIAPGVWTVLGYCGRGVAMATTMGLVLGDMLSGGHKLSYPASPLKPIPLSMLRRPMLQAGIAYYRLRDALNRAA